MAHGLLDIDGNPKPEFHALMEVLRMPTLTERVELLERRMNAEEQRNQRLIEWLARYGLGDLELAYYARLWADEASPGILDTIRAQLPNR